MKNISAWAIRHPVTPIVLFVVLFFLGTVAFIRLPINLNPDVSFPVVDVTVTQPGAAPQEMETQIAQKVEGSISSIGNVHHIQTVISEGLTFISIEFQIGTPIDRAVTDVRDAIAKVRSDLPQGIFEPQVQREDVDGGAFVYYALSTTDMTPEQLSWAVDNTITKRLLAVSGVAQVQRIGGVNREIRVELDPGRLQAMGITAVEVNEQLRQLNVNATGGRAQVGGGEQAIRVLGSAQTAEALADAQIIVSGGKFVRLREIADVRDGVEEIRSIAKYNGRPATAFGVFKAKGASDVSTSQAVTKELDKILQENPSLHLQQIFTTVDHTIATYHSALSALVEGSVLAVVVVWFFLRSWRATLISALAIPLSAIPTFAFMSAMGFTLNSITLLSLSLVAGVLVDDAIVEIENIVRHMRMGKTGFRAAMDAADEIGLAVVATSFTIIAVFLPVSFMGGISGQYFKQFGLTVAMAVFISLMVARMITPVMAAYALRSDAIPQHSNDGPIMTAYIRALKWCVANRWKTIGAGTLFFAMSVAGAMAIPKSFVPPEDFSTSIINVELPPGGKLEDTERVCAAATAILRRAPEVTDVVEFIGTERDEIRTASLFVSLVPANKRKLSAKEWEQHMAPLLNQVPDGHLIFNGMGFGGRDVNLFLVGDNPEIVERAGHQLLREMRGLRELSDPRIRGDFPRPEILVHPRLDIAAQLGVSVQSISQTIRIATLGDLPQFGAKFALNDRQIPIRVSLPERSRSDLSTIENLPVPTAAGDSVPLKTVAELTFGEGPSTIRRFNLSRRLFLDSDLAPGVQLGTALDKVHKLPALMHLPTGVHLVETGDTEFMNELFANFLVAIAAGVLMVLAVLVLLFVRVFQPITILSALPLSLGGAVLALALTNTPFSLPVVIGVLMLMGIVAKNSILLVDFAIEEMRAGKTRMQAIVESGHKRARPIVMTTVAMVAGMLPTATGIGGDNSFRAPMAIAVIGGLITSTLLTLVIVPAVFTLFDDIERWLAPKAASLLADTPSVGQDKPALASDRAKLPAT
jgi:hydrophobe/amphiphile efflux-1 (HAE1) family protein